MRSPNPFAGQKSKSLFDSNLGDTYAWLWISLNKHSPPSFAVTLQQMYTPPCTPDPNIPTAPTPQISLHASPNFSRHHDPLGEDTDGVDHVTVCVLPEEVTPEINWTPAGNVYCVISGNFSLKSFWIRVWNRETRLFRYKEIRAGLLPALRNVRMNCWALTMALAIEPWPSDHIESTVPCVTSNASCNLNHQTQMHSPIQHNVIPRLPLHSRLQAHNGHRFRFPRPHLERRTPMAPYRLHARINTARSVLGGRGGGCNFARNGIPSNGL